MGWGFALNALAMCKLALITLFTLIFEPIDACWIVDLATLVRVFAKFGVLFK